MCSHQVPNVFSSYSQFIANMFSSLKHVLQDVPNSIITLYNLCLNWKSPYIGGPKALTSKIPLWVCKLPFGGMSNQSGINYFVMRPIKVTHCKNEKTKNLGLHPTPP